MPQKRALITGITGQDGSYLAERLLECGYEVHGLIRRIALEDERRLSRIEHIRKDLRLHPVLVENHPGLCKILGRHQFGECYHLGAQSFVADNFDDGFTTMDVNIKGTHAMLAALREISPECRFYFAASSEIFGRVSKSPQDERTELHPRNPYGISKVAGFHLTRNYREEYGMFCVSGILFNHESPRRGREFVTRKITSTAARIRCGLAKELRLGNLEARRDWGHAADFVEAMRLMLRQDEPSDFVIATGETHSVRDFCSMAFEELGLDYREFVVVDDRFYRPVEETQLVGDSSKARRKLGWEPKRTFKQLVAEMVQADLEALQLGRAAD